MHEEALELSTGWGRLAGTLAWPEGKGPFPAVLLIAGSGPTDRDGNNPLLAQPCDNLKLLAAALAARGLASLRYDKRGIGASAYPGLDEEALRFGDMVDDAVALGRKLRDDARVASLLVLGHSEGSLIAALAAAALVPQAVASVSGAGERASALMRKQFALLLSPELARSAGQALDALEAQRAVEDVPPDLLLLFRPSVQPYLMSWFRHDPAQVLAGLQVPALLVHGGADTQVPVEHARLLHAARPEARLRIVEGMDHLLALEGDVAGGVAIVADEVAALAAATSSTAAR